MLSFPNAKINLGLNVIRKRDDGYHDIETVFLPYMEIRDILEIVFSEEPGIIQYGLPLDGNPKDNLCYKAYELMEQKYGISPVQIHLYKNIPTGAGLGGGSADAAFTLSMLNTLFNLGLDKAVLADLSSNLGCDCPFFIYNEPMIATGRGDILSPYQIPELSDYSIRLTTPPFAISTHEAYCGIHPHPSETSIKEILQQPIDKWRTLLHNDFEEIIFAKYPEIGKLKQSFYSQGAVYASMSGSGSSVFGLFKKKKDGRH